MVLFGISIGVVFEGIRVTRLGFAFVFLGRSLFFVFKEVRVFVFLRFGF